MSILRRDMERIWHAVEVAVGANKGANAGTWDVENIWGVSGLGITRTYYVVVNVYGVANPFQIWVITLTPNSVPGWTAVQSGTGYATPAAAVTAVDVLVTALSVQSVPVGPLVQ